MNDPKMRSSPLDDQVLDKLVDGELAETERCQLITNFEAQPDGWRRCALAFLEAQSWKNELTSFAGEATEQPAAAARPQSRAIREAPQAGRKLAGRTATGVAMAASFLLTLWLGWVIQDAFRLNLSPSPGLEKIAGSGSVPPSDALAQAPERSQNNENVGAQATEMQQRPIVSRGPWQVVTLSAGGPDGQRAKAIDLPACEWQLVDSQWPNSLPSALPREVLQSLERSGYRVRHHRELLPVEMQDGQRLLVPVEEVEVQYVGQPPL